MTAQVAAAPRSATAARPLAAVLGSGALLWLLLFRAEAAAAVHVWETSTAYGHCFLVLPVAAWLAWDRRAALSLYPARPFPAAMLLALPLAAMWLLAERLGLMEGRQLAAVGLLLVLALGVLGPSLWWSLAVPLLYLLFLVPFGGFLVGPLQMFTAQFVDVGLDLLGIPHVVTSLVIEIPEGTFRVAEACAGLRFLIAAIAFGVIYACTLYRRPGRRLVFIAASIVVPIVANGVRALGIVLLGHLLGSAEAGAVDHVLYGWIFFSIVILLLILAGLPFREDLQPARRRTGAPGLAQPLTPSGGVLAIAAGILLVAAIGPAIAGSLDAAALREVRRLPADAAGFLPASLPTPPGCVRTGTDRFDCAGVTIAVQAELFARRASTARLLAAARMPGGMVDPEAAFDLDWIARTVDGPLLWHVTGSDPGAPIVATALRAGGLWDGTGLRMRLRQAWSSVAGGTTQPLLVTVTEEPNQLPPADALALLRTFLQFQSQSIPHDIAGRP